MAWLRSKFWNFDDASVMIQNYARNSSDRVQRGRGVDVKKAVEHLKTKVQRLSLPCTTCNLSPFCPSNLLKVFQRSEAPSVHPLTKRLKPGKGFQSKCLSTCSSCPLLSSDVMVTETNKRNRWIGRTKANNTNKIVSTDNCCVNRENKRRCTMSQLSRADSGWWNTLQEPF